MWIAILGLTIIFIVALFLFGALKIIRPQRAEPQRSRWLPAVDPAAYGIARWVPVRISSFDGVPLIGWILLPSGGQQRRGSVLLLHGLSSCKAYMLPIAQHFVEAGFAVLSFDARAQGESGGRFCTYGEKEVKDLRIILDFVEERFPQLMPLAVVGHSLGGAVAIQALAQEPRLQCGIVIGAFASLPDIVAYYCRTFYAIPFRWVANGCLALAGWLADFSPFQIVPERSAQRVQQPVMVIHGEEDRDVPVAHGKRIYAALASHDKVWFGVPEAGHYALDAVAGDAYFAAQIAFLEQHLGEMMSDGMSVSAQSRSGSALS